MLITVIAAVNEFERDMMLERQAEGIEIAKSRGSYKNCGRKKTEIDEEEFSEDLKLLQAGKITQENRILQ